MRDAEPGVCHLDDGGVVFAAGGEAHGAAFRRELDPVGDEVVDDAEKLRPVGGHHRERLSRDHESDAFRRGRGAGRLGRLVQDPFEIDGLSVELERMRVGAREEEELVDEAREPGGISLRDPRWPSRVGESGPSAGSSAISR